MRASDPMPEITRLHGLPAFRGVLHIILIAGFVLSALSLALRKERVLGTTAIAAT